MNENEKQPPVLIPVSAKTPPEKSGYYYTNCGLLYYKHEENWWRYFEDEYPEMSSLSCVEYWYKEQSANVDLEKEAEKVLKKHWGSDYLKNGLLEQKTIPAMVQFAQSLHNAQTQPEKSDAVEFANWTTKMGWSPYYSVEKSEGDEWINEQDFESKYIRTTEQLYELFKSETQNKQP